MLLYYVIFRFVYCSCFTSARGFSSSTSATPEILFELVVFRMGFQETLGDFCWCQFVVKIGPPPNWWGPNFLLIGWSVEEKTMCGPSDLLVLVLACLGLSLCSIRSWMRRSWRFHHSRRNGLVVKLWFNEYNILMNTEYKIIRWDMMGWFHFISS